MIKRDILQPIIDHLDEKEITVIIGPRQVGKTTLLDQIEKYLLQEKQISKTNIFRFNLDIIRDRDFF
ncbi:MAG: AAA family ATPase, partial [Xanthomonadaceae bacterium]|nr:AAA family ATPase [Rhodospirillaceae bacterium]NIA18054.1 AAA family ATPase [Xanthomonadaceae bacterium]